MTNLQSRIVPGLIEGLAPQLLQELWEVPRDQLRQDVHAIQTSRSNARQEPTRTAETSNHRNARGHESLWAMRY